MARITNYGTQSYASTRPTFIGRPVEAIKESNDYLNNRYDKNKTSYEQGLDALEALSVEDRNAEIKDSQIKSTTDMFKSVIQGNDFEHADRTVTQAVREIKDNKTLKGAVQSKLLYDTWSEDLEKRVDDNNLPMDTANKLRSETAAINYKKIEVDENGIVKNMFSTNRVVNDPKIHDQIESLTAKLKASSMPLEINGKTMFNAGVEGFKYTGQTESINEVEAAQNIKDFILSKPENQSWLTQQKRLDDNVMAVRNEDGTFKLDANGNPIIDIQSINQREYAKSLGFTDDSIDDYFKSYSKLASDGNINPNTYSLERQNELINGMINANYGTLKVMPVAQAGVGIVDYDKVELKYLTDHTYIARLRRGWKLEDDAKILERAHQRFDYVATPSDKRNMTIGELSGNTSKANAAFLDSQELLQNAAVNVGALNPAAGEKLKVISNVNGTPELKVVNADGSMRDLNDGTGKVQEDFTANYLRTYAEKELYQKNFDAVMKEVSPDEQMQAKLDALEKFQLLQGVTAVGGFIKLGAQGVGNMFAAGLDTEQTITQLNELHATSKGLISHGVNSFSNGDLTNAQIEKAYAEAIKNPVWGDVIQHSTNANYKEILNNPTIAARYEAIQLDKYNNSIYAGTATPITNSSLPGIKEIEAAGENQILSNYKSAVDKSGKNIMENKSEITPTDFEHAMQKGNFTISYTTSAGKPQLLVSSNYLNDKNKSSGGSFEFFIDAPKGFGQYLETDQEQIHTAVVQAFTPLNANDLDGKHVTYDAGAKFTTADGTQVHVKNDIRVERVALNANNRIISNNDDIANKTDWGYLVQQKTVDANGSPVTYSYMTKDKTKAVNLATETQYRIKQQHGLIPKRSAKNPNKLVYPYDMPKYEVNR